MAFFRSLIVPLNYHQNGGFSARSFVCLKKVFPTIRRCSHRPNFRVGQLFSSFSLPCCQWQQVHVKPSCYINNTKINTAFYLFGLCTSSTSLSGYSRVRCHVLYQVALCGAIWQVMLHRVFPKELFTTFNLYVVCCVIVLE